MGVIMWWVWNFLVVTITNFSKTNISEIPRFKGDIKLTVNNALFLDLYKVNYPIALDPGDKHSYKVSIMY
jgi:hypothetical protein